MQIEGKRFWIIGASEGIGRETAKLLAKKGAKICASSMGEERLMSLIDEAEGDGHQVATCDVTCPDSVKEAHAKLKEQGTIDAVIYFAGVYEPMAWDEWNLDMNLKTIDVNFSGVFRVIEALKEDINEGALKRFILTGSVAGYRGLPKALAYGATKAATNYLAEALRLDLEEKNVTIQLITPGFVKTRLTDKNSFDMPLRITPEQAAKSIVTGIEKDRFEIHFPRVFTYIMKTLQMLPHWLYFRIAKSL